MIKTRKEAINFLRNNAMINVEIVDYKYRVWDKDFNQPIKTNKELIDYANEQKEALDDRGGD